MLAYSPSMLRRFLLTLLVLCLALPTGSPAVGAAQAAHEMTMAMHAGHHTEVPIPASDHHGGKHQCIGCAAQFDRADDEIAEIHLMPEAVPLARTTVFAGLAAPPATPPPRS